MITAPTLGYICLALFLIFLSFMMLLAFKVTFEIGVLRGLSIAKIEAEKEIAKDREIKLAIIEGRNSTKQ